MDRKLDYEKLNYEYERQFGGPGPQKLNYERQFDGQGIIIMSVVIMTVVSVVLIGPITYLLFF